MSTSTRSPRRRILLPAVLALGLGMGHAPQAHATGIPVIDIANLIQTIQQVLNDITEISNQVQQIEQLQAQVESINGSRMLGNFANSAALQNYIPANAYSYINAVDTGGYSGLSGTARSLRDASMVYNCEGLADALRTRCQAELAQPYQQKGLLQDAMSTASGRLSQIRALMNQIDATADQKAVQEIQARISAENAMLSHEVSQIQMLSGMADSEERIERSRQRERQLQGLRRAGQSATYLP
jgi:type IV secretion system protein VirB5